MPELPEIETVKRTLAPLISGASITACRIERPQLIKHPSSDDFSAQIVGQKILDTGRRGKFLLINLQSQDTLIAHLRMTGRMLCTPSEYPLLPHTHVIFELDNGRELRFADARRFGCLWFKRADEEDDFTGISRLGIEPFDENFGPNYLKEKLANRKVTIKQGILDQSVLAGLGNIYADEVLFAAGVDPTRKTNTITDDEWAKIAEATPPILRSSIANNGTTFSEYLDGEGHKGNNMPFLQVYKRTGMPCNRCGTTIMKIKVGGRGTHFCPNCQK